MSDSLRPHGCNLPDSSIYGIFQARLMVWVAIYNYTLNLNESTKESVSLSPFCVCVCLFLVFFFSVCFVFYFPFIFISWRLITLQYCSGFCHTLTWISHGFTCIPHLESILQMNAQTVKPHWVTFVYSYFGCTGSSLLLLRLLLVAGRGGYSPAAVHRLLLAMTSLVVEHRLWVHELRSCGSWAALLCSMWDLPRSEIKPVSTLH